MPVEIVRSNIVDLIKYSTKVSAYVNAANPYLLSDCENSGVNYSFFDRFGDTFQKRNLETLESKNLRKLNRGDALLVEHVDEKLNYIVINAVSPVFKYGDEKELSVLRKCYKSIFHLAEDRKIERLYIPILGAGSFNKNEKLPYDSLFRLAYAEAYNYFVDLSKRGGEELYHELKSIIFVIIDETKFKMANEIHNHHIKHNYKKKILERTACEAQVHYYRSVNERDQFWVTKRFRQMLLFIHYFLIGFWVKQVSGKLSWESRRIALELMPLVKITAALIMISIFSFDIPYNSLICIIISYYLILDTLVPLAAFVFLNDVLKPSANPIRSLVLLLLNYVELLFMFGVIYSSALGIGWNGLSISLNVNYGIDIDTNTITSLKGPYILIQNIIMGFFNLVIFGNLISALSPRKYINQ